MSCCTPTGYRTIFGSKTAEREARRYRRRGLPGSARWLVRTLTTTGVKGRSVLEVGGGVGGLQIELLEAGADRSTNVEIIDTYERAAETLIAERDLSGRVERRIDDFAAAAAETPPADLVVLHRVICCYPDADVLVVAACEHARERLAITIPRESAWIRAGVGVMNAWLAMRRIQFRTYVHARGPMLAAAAGRGFRLADRHDGIVWQSFVLERAAPSGA
jgi:magnesium-protoporphyrin O-methyltransferase